MVIVQNRLISLQTAGFFKRQVAGHRNQLTIGKYGKKFFQLLPVMDGGRHDLLPLVISITEKLCPLGKFITSFSFFARQ
jgi:hypothetical protein